MSIHKDVKLVSHIFDFFHTSAAENLSEVEGGPHQIVALPQSAASASKNSDGPWSTEGPHHDVISILMLPTWKNEKDDDKVRQWTERVTEEINHLAKSEGKLDKFVYVNDANERQDSYATLSPENFERMREISKKYDPDGVFQKLREGGPKLWEPLRLN